MDLIAAKAVNNSNILIPGAWVLGHWSLSCCLWSHFLSHPVPPISSKISKGWRENTTTVFRDQNWLGWSRQYPLSVETSAAGSCFTAKISVKEHKQVLVLSSEHTGYTHDRYYWSNLARTSRSYNGIGGPSWRLRQRRSRRGAGGYHTPWRAPRHLRSSNLLCPRTRRRFVLRYSSCALGLRISEQNSLSFRSAPWESTSVAQFLPQLTVALLQSCPSARNVLCPQHF